MFCLTGLRRSGSQADEGEWTRTSPCTHTFYVYIRTNTRLDLSVKGNRSFSLFQLLWVIFFFLAMGETSSKSTLLGISCSNTFSIDLYQRLCLQSERGWARYNIAWHKNLLVCHRRQFTATSRAKQTGYSALTPPQQCTLYGKLLQPVTGYKSTLLDDDWAERIAATVVSEGYAIITKGRASRSDLPRGAVLTLTFRCELKVGLTHTQRGDKDLTIAASKWNPVIYSWEV